MVAGCQGMAENGILRKGAVTQVTAPFVDNTIRVVVFHIFLLTFFVVLVKMLIRIQC